jgi:hypothetical protein
VEGLPVNPAEAVPATLVTGWHVPGRYLLYAFLLGLVIRVFMAGLRAVERPAGRPYFPTVLALIRGRGSHGLVPDYWHPFIIGTLELLAYPIILKTGNVNVVGAWLGLKTLAQWKVWGENRVHFNRFLIGNALVLIVSALVLAPLVIIENKP